MVLSAVRLTMDDVGVVADKNQDGSWRVAT